MSLNKLHIAYMDGLRDRLLNRPLETMPDYVDEDCVAAYKSGWRLGKKVVQGDIRLGRRTDGDRSSNPVNGGSNPPEAAIVEVDVNAAELKIASAMIAAEENVTANVNTGTGGTAIAISPDS